MAIEEVAITAQRLPPLLTMDNLRATLADVSVSSRERLSQGIRLLDRDAIDYALGAYGGRIRESEFASHEAFRRSLNAADAFNAGDAQLIMAFPDGMNAEDKLRNAIRAGGGENPTIKYTMVDGKPFIVVGNNRFLAAQRLGRLNELRFQRVDFPVDGTNFRTAQDVLDTVGTVKPPKYRGK